jgi:hypothetical protein
LKDVSRRSWQASRLRSRRPRQRRRPPRVPMGRLRQPSWLLLRCLLRPRRRPIQPHRRRLPLRRHRRRHRLRQQRKKRQQLQLSSQLRRSRRRCRVQECRAHLVRRPPLGSTRGQLHRRDRVPVLPADFRALPARPVGVREPRALATTRSLPRKEWVSRARRVPVQMAAGPPGRVRPLAALLCRAVVRGYRACRDPTQR